MDSQPLLGNDLDIILDRIGLGKYHLYAFATIFLAILGDGCSMTIYGLLAPILKKIWELNYIQLSILSGSVFVGCIAGSIVSMIFGDTKGRLWTLKLGLIIESIGILGCPLTQEYLSLSLMLFLMGVGIGVIATLADTYTVDIIPSKFRGSFNILVHIGLYGGQIFVALTAMVFAPALDSNSDWKSLLACSAVVVIAGCIMAFFIIQESPRFCAQVGRYQDAIEIINYICQMNDKSLMDVQEENTINSIDLKQKVQFKNLIGYFFKRENLPLFAILASMRAISMFSFYTLIFLITNIDSIKQNYDEINILLINCVVGMVASILGAITVEHQSIGRKKLLLITAILSSLFMVLGFVLSDYSFHVLGIFISNFFITIQYLTVGLYINEAYGTKVRNTAGSLTFMISRFGSILGPFLVLATESLIPGVSLIMISVIQIVFMVLCIISPVETKNKPLDEQLSM